MTVEPDEFEAGEEGDLIDDESDDDDDEIEIDDVAALIDVPAGAVGDVLSEAELFRLRRTYAGSVTLADHCLGELFEAMRRLGRMDDTLLVFTSDQGEPLGEHGFVRRFRPWLYEELIHTPLDRPDARAASLAGSGTRPSFRRSTCCRRSSRPSAYRRSCATRRPLHGHDLLPLIRGEQTKVRDYACMGMDVAEFAIRTHLWHLIVPIENDPDEPRTAELFRKPEDRWDQNNVIDQNIEVAEHLELALRRFVEAAQTRHVRRASLPPRRRPAWSQLNRSAPPAMTDRRLRRRDCLVAMPGLPGGDAAADLFFPHGRCNPSSTAPSRRGDSRSNRSPCRTTLIFWNHTVSTQGFFVVWVGDGGLNVIRLRCRQDRIRAWDNCPSVGRRERGGRKLRCGQRLVLLFDEETGSGTCGAAAEGPSAAARRRSAGRP